MEFWSVRFVPKYLNCSTISTYLLSIFILWLRPAFWSRDMTIRVYLVVSAFTSTPNSVLASTKRYAFWKHLYHVILGLVPFAVHLKAQSRIVYCTFEGTEPYLLLYIWRHRAVPFTVHLKAQWRIVYCAFEGTGPYHLLCIWRHRAVPFTVNLKAQGRTVYCTFEGTGP